ncbi:putative hypothetical protein [Clostridium botulinum BKT015925]|nr:putative hypothetical protein [Clostridium botulinum BKT015925]
MDILLINISIYHPIFENYKAVSVVLYSLTAFLSIKLIFFN